jgi:hypothetical protein
VRLFLADVLYFKGRAQLALNQLDAAHATLIAARAEAEALTSRRTLWRILDALGELDTSRGHHAEAHALRQQAREIVQFIADHAPAEYRASFLNQPDVRALVS